MKRKPFSLQTRFYFFLSAIIAVGIFNEAVVQYLLWQQSDVAAHISIAGYQRTLSQRISKLALYVERDVMAGDDFNKTRRLDTLKRISETWKIEFDSLLNPASSSSPALMAMLYENKAKHDAITLAVDKMLASPDSATIKRSVAVIVAHELPFLIQMEKITNAFRKEAEDRLASQKVITLMLGIGALLVLGIGFVRIFYRLLKQQGTLNALLEKSLTDLKEASHAKENFMSIISHEIRTPLNSVIGLSNLLLRRNPRKDQEEVVQTLKNSADNLLHLVNDILDFNKIQAGKVDLEFADFSFNKFLQQLHAMFATAAEDKGLTFRVKADPRIPDMLVGDVNRLTQIFNNLLSNAIKFTHRGQVTVDANLNSVDHDICNLTIEVKDTGIGIAADKVETIFQPFEQGDVDVTRKYGGTGLGLTIVKNLVHLFNGKISLISTPGQGSVFSVQIAFKLALPDRNEPTIEKHPFKFRKANKPVNVLYVEDVKSNRFLIKNLLVDAGHTCVTASSGNAALKITAAQPFDLILMDIQMPGMDGYSATQAIHNQPDGQNRNTPVVAFTAEPFSEQLKSKMIAHGIADVITKPFEPETLLDKVVQYSSAHQGVNGGQKLISFAFYEYAFNSNAEQLNEIKEILKQDLTEFEQNFTAKSNDQDLPGMREEIHRIRPIIKNLKCEELIVLFDSLRLQESYSQNLSPVAMQVSSTVRKIMDEVALLEYR
jgi:signal transduction histidine kinase/DNA-binding response OmpR family regulator